jgi:hypothetical protein
MLNLWTLMWCNVVLWSRLRVGLAHISDPVVCDLPGFTRRKQHNNSLLLLNVTWIGLGDNTELFWAVLSHWRRDWLVAARFDLLNWFASSSPCELFAATDLVSALGMDLSGFFFDKTFVSSLFGVPIPTCMILSPDGFCSNAWYRTILTPTPTRNRRLELD